MLVLRKDGITSGRCSSPPKAVSCERLLVFVCYLFLHLCNKFIKLHLTDIAFSTLAYGHGFSFDLFLADNQEIWNFLKFCLPDFLSECFVVHINFRSDAG